MRKIFIITRLKGEKGMKLDYIITLNTIMENLINNVSTVTPSLKFKFLGIMRDLAPHLSIERIV